MPLRIALIGPNRRRTGTGPFVAAFLRQAGCRVNEWDRAQAARFLADGVRPAEMDGVAICSPPETHIHYLAAAVKAGLHVFCEKPIVWPEGHSSAAFANLIAELADVLDAAGGRGLVVHENTQWTYTLQDFRRIAADVPPDAVAQFRCELSPSGETAPEMLMECSAHANSLLLELGCSGVEDLRIRHSLERQALPAAMEIDFRSRNRGDGAVIVQYRFTRRSGQPRHAAYEVNHHRAERRIELEGYRIYLRSASGECLIRDPLQRSVEHFTAQAGGAPPGRRCSPRILENIRMSYLFLKHCPPQEASHA